MGDMGAEFQKRGLKYGGVEHKSLRRKSKRAVVKSLGRPKKKKVGKYD
jgi:hypothetical protein